MEQLPTASRRKSLGRVIALAARVAIGAVCAVAAQLLIGVAFGSHPDPSSGSGIEQKSAASVLIATAHEWAAEAARRRDELAEKEAARQARIDIATEDLLDHD